MDIVCYEGTLYHLFCDLVTINDKFQIYLVTGGYNSYTYDFGHRFSTELLARDGDAWVLYENSLPTERYFAYGVASVSLNNEIFLSGQYRILFSIKHTTLGGMNQLLVC